MTKRARAGAAAFVTVLCAAAAVAATSAPAGASADRASFGGMAPGNLLVSESFYSNDPGIVAGQTQLPPGCTAGNCVTATANPLAATAPAGGEGFRTAVLASRPRLR